MAGPNLAPGVLRPRRSGPLPAGPKDQSRAAPTPPLDEFVGLARHQALEMSFAAIHGAARLRSTRRPGPARARPLRFAGKAARYRRHFPAATAARTTSGAVPATMPKGRLLERVR